MFVFVVGLGSSSQRSKGSCGFQGLPRRTTQDLWNSSLYQRLPLNSKHWFLWLLKIPTKHRWLRVHDVFHLRTFWRKRSCQQLEGPFTKKVEFEGQRGPLVTEWQARIATKVTVCVKLEVHPGGQRGRCTKPSPTQMYKASATQETKHLYETEGAIYRLVNTQAGSRRKKSEYIFHVDNSLSSMNMHLHGKCVPFRSPFIILIQTSSDENFSYAPNQKSPLTD